jgi:hypothetical protein
MEWIRAPLLRSGGIVGGGLATNRCIVSVDDAPTCGDLYKYFTQNIAAVGIGRAAGIQSAGPECIDPRIAGRATLRMKRQTGSNGAVGFIGITSGFPVIPKPTL